MTFSPPYADPVPIPGDLASAAVLAGGEGKRLGFKKVLIHLDGENLLLQLLEKLRGVFQEVLLVTRSDASPEEMEVFREAMDRVGVRLVSDIYPGRGPLGGIHASLYHVTSPLVFVTACDMPFPSLPLVRALLERARGREAAVPRRGEYIEPLFAVYARKVTPKAEEFLEKGILQVQRFIDSLDVYYMEDEEVSLYDPERASFRNINSREDLESLCRRTEGPFRDAPSV